MKCFAPVLAMMVCIRCFAQQQDTLRISVFEKAPVFFSPPDEFQKDTFPLKTIPDVFYWMGFTGLNSPEYVFRTTESELCWKWNQNRTNNARSPFFLQSKKPFIRVCGNAGQRQWQDFTGIFSFPAFKEHGQNTVFLNRGNGLGFYARQQTFWNNFFITSFVEKSKWGYSLLIQNVRQKFQENGGVQSDTLNENDELLAKEFLAVNFYSANVRNSKWKASVLPYLKILQDSASQKIFLIGWEIKLDQSSHFYLHDNLKSESRYPAIFYDSLKTRDSVYHIRAGTGPLLKSQFGSHEMILKYLYHAGKFYQYGDSFYRQGITELAWNYRKGKWFAGINGNIILHGFFRSNYSGNFRIRKISVLPNQNDYAEASIGVFSQAPPWLFIRQKGNHYQWNNDYRNVLTLQGEMKYSSSWFRFSFLYQKIKNMFFSDAQGYPFFYSSFLNRISIKTEGTFALWGVWKHEPGIIWQYTEVPVLFRYPELLPKYISYVDVYLFRRNMRVQSGVDIRYIPSFIPYAYNPNLQLYYLKTLPATKSWWWISPFVSFRVSPAQFYVRAENLMNLFVRQTQSWVYKYPQPGFWLYAGVCWDFRD